jgi:Putative zinc-finger
MDWNCTHVEERLSDFLDNLLAPEEVTELNRHLDSCANCASLMAQVGGTLQRLRAVQQVEPPARLMRSILEQTSGVVKEPKGWRRWFQWNLQGWQPRFAMGAMTVAASVTILFFAVGLSPAKVKRGELNPTNWYRAANRQGHLVYARGVKYVNDLRVVYEIQSRLRPEESPSREQREQQSTPQQQPQNPQEKSQGDPHPGRSSNRSTTLYATSLASVWMERFSGSGL